MWPNPQNIADLITFTEEILREKRNFLYGATSEEYMITNLNQTKSQCVLLNT